MHVSFWLIKFLLFHHQFPTDCVTVGSDPEQIPPLLKSYSYNNSRRIILNNFTHPKGRVKQYIPFLVCNLCKRDGP